MSTSATIPGSADVGERVAMNWLLALGLLLRVGVCCLASPFNRDQHLAVIDFIVQRHALPVSNVLQQSYHPPLYYLLMTPLRWLSPAATWPLHVASLAFSCANVFALRRIMDDPLVRGVGASRAFRIVAFALVATLGELILFGSFISNDPLTQLIGTLLFAACLRYLREPTRRGVAVLASWVALGLLTKGTFLLTGLALVPIILRGEWPRSAGRAARVAILFCLVWAALGSFKYVDNLVRLGRPFVHNQELWSGQYGPLRSIWRGPATIYDLDVTKLIRHPIVRATVPTSYPLTLYATFWYAHFGDSSFDGNINGYDLVGRIIYGTAVIPTLLAVLGGALAVASIPRWLRGGDDPARAAIVCAASLVAANLAVVVAAGVRFDVWEAFQGRLLFQSAMPIVLLFLVGARHLPRWPAVRVPILAACWATVTLAVLYFCIEFALAKHLLEIDFSIAPEVLAR